MCLRRTIASESNAAARPRPALRRAPTGARPSAGLKLRGAPAGARAGREHAPRRRSAAAVHASERLYRTLAAHFPRGAIVLFDHDLRFIVADGAGLAGVGLSPEKLVGKTLHEVFPRAISAQFEPCYRAALAGEEMHVEVAFGRAIYEVTTLPVRDDAGVVIAGMVLTIDATERQQVARRMRDAEERYRLLVEQLPAMTYTSAIEGERTSTLYMSPRGEQLFGYSAAAWTATPDFWLQVLHPEDRQWVRAAIADSNLTGQPWTLKYRCLAHDGRVVWVHDAAVLVRDAAGRRATGRALRSTSPSSRRLRPACVRARRFSAAPSIMPASAWRSARPTAVFCVSTRRCAPSSATARPNLRRSRCARSATRRSRFALRRPGASAGG